MEFYCKSQNSLTAYFPGSDFKTSLVYHTNKTVLLMNSVSYWINY